MIVSFPEIIWLRLWVSELVFFPPGVAYLSITGRLLPNWAAAV